MEMVYIASAETFRTGDSNGPVNNLVFRSRENAVQALVDQVTNEDVSAEKTEIAKKEAREILTDCDEATIALGDLTFFLEIEATVLRD